MCMCVSSQFVAPNGSTQNILKKRRYTQKTFSKEFQGSEDTLGREEPKTWGKAN